MGKKRHNYLLQLVRLSIVVSYVRDVCVLIIPKKNKKKKKAKNSFNKVVAEKMAFSLELSPGIQKLARVVWRRFFTSGRFFIFFFVSKS